MKINPDKIRIFFATSLLILSLFFTFFGIEQFPFSNYPMFSTTQHSTQRLTLVFETTSGQKRLVNANEMYPLGRIHLGYLLKHYLAGNESSKNSVHNLIKGLFQNDSNVRSIDIALATFTPGKEKEKPFEYLVVKSFEHFNREGLSL